MKATKYMSSAHFLEFIKVGIAAGESKAIAEQTKKTAKTPQEKDWAKRLAIAATHLGKVTDERMACLDPDQAKTVDRRWKNSEVRIRSRSATMEFAAMPSLPTYRSSW